MRVQAWYFEYKLLPSLSWAFLTAPDGYTFVTSDRPLVWLIPGEGFADSPAALTHPNVQVSVPLNPFHALFGFKMPLSVDTKIHVDTINHRTIDYAERFVIASTSNSEWAT